MIDRLANQRAASHVARSYPQIFELLVGSVSVSALGHIDFGDLDASLMAAKTHKKPQGAHNDCQR